MAQEALGMVETRGLTAASTAPDFHRDSLLIPIDTSIGNLTGAKLMVIF